MKIGELKRRYYAFRLREARGAVLLLGTILSLLTALIVYLAFVTGPGADIFNHGLSRQPDVVCNTYGEGADVCFPAPDGVKKYREDVRAARKAKNS